MLSWVIWVENTINTTQLEAKKRVLNQLTKTNMRHQGGLISSSWWVGSLDAHLTSKHLMLYLKSDCYVIVEQSCLEVLINVIAPTLVFVNI